MYSHLKGNIVDSMSKINSISKINNPAYMKNRSKIIIALLFLFLLSFYGCTNTNLIIMDLNLKIKSIEDQLNELDCDNLENLNQEQQEICINLLAEKEKAAQDLNDQEDIIKEANKVEAFLKNDIISDPEPCHLDGHCYSFSTDFKFLGIHQENQDVNFYFLDSNKKEIGASGPEIKGTQKRIGKNGQYTLTKINFYSKRPYTGEGFIIVKELVNGNEIEEYMARVEFLSPVAFRDSFPQYFSRN